MAALEREEDSRPADPAAGPRHEHDPAAVRGAHGRQIICCHRATKDDELMMSDILTGLDERVLAAVDDDETLDLLASLVAAPSANPPGDEGEVVRVLATALEREGIKPRLENVHPRRPNLAAELGPAGGPTLLFNGHTDTMPPGKGWTTDPYTAVLRDSRLYGPGAC